MNISILFHFLNYHTEGTTFNRKDDIVFFNNNPLFQTSFSEEKKNKVKGHDNFTKICIFIIVEIMKSFIRIRF